MTTAHFPTNRKRLRILLIALMTATSSTIAFSQTKDSDEAKNEKGPRPSLPSARLVWQDGSDQSLHWSDVYRDGDVYSMKPEQIVGFPKLDEERQNMVQMADTNGLLVVGVHDKINVTFQSGWVALSTGVIEEPHGNHSHWHCEDAPSICASDLSADQGNPAHVYEYQ